MPSVRPVVNLVHRLEDLALIGALLLILVLALLQILLRNVFDTGILWADPFLRTLVLWITMLGAMVATRENNHIAIDLVSRYMARVPAAIVAFMTSTLAALICLLVAYYSLDLVRIEYEDKTVAFASVPIWLCQSILPFGFLIMALRFFTNGVLLLARTLFS